MPVNVIKARLSSLRKNLPSWTTEAVAREFNSMVQQLEDELQDPEIASFQIADRDIKPRIVSVAPGRGANYSKDKYCDNQLFKRQVDGLWEYLIDSKVIEGDAPQSKPKRPAQAINIYGNVTGSTIQQGDNNTATVTYRQDAQAVIDEIRSVLNAQKLTRDAKAELTAEVETAEVQLKSPRPKHTIIKECFVSARHILEHGFGAGMAHAYFPLLLAFLEHHK